MTTRCTPREAAELVRPPRHDRIRARPRQPRRVPHGARASATTGSGSCSAARSCSATTPCCTKPGVSYRCGFFGPAERILLAEGHDIELVPGGFRQFAPILARFAPRIMTAQARAARRGRPGESLAALRRHARRAAARRAATPTALLLVEVNPQLPRTNSSRARVRQHAPARADRRRRRDRRRPVRPLDDAVAVPDRRGHRGASARVRDRRQHVADGHRRRCRTWSQPAGRRERAVTTACTRDVHDRSHAPASGRQGDQRRARASSTGCR